MGLKPLSSPNLDHVATRIAAFIDHISPSFLDQSRSPLVTRTIRILCSQRTAVVAV
jgi:hypothetical protein